MSLKTWQQYVTEAKEAILHGDEDLNEAIVRLKYEKEFDSATVGEFFSACTHYEGTEQQVPLEVSYLGKRGDSFNFNGVFYDPIEKEFYIGDFSFKFDYGGSMVSGPYTERAEAARALKGKRI